MEGKITLIGNFATDWIKYSDYEYRESSTGNTYIVPTEDAVFTMYNPFNVPESILMDLMEIGDLALKTKKEKEEKPEELKAAILRFAKKYGLLGLISSSVYNRNIIGEDNVLMIENNHVTKEKIIGGSEYINWFIPFIEERDIIFKKHKRGIDVVKGEDSPKFYGKRPIVMDLIFSRFYCEKIDWIIDFAKMIVSHFNQLLVYRKTSKYLTENVTIMAGKFHAEKIGFTINQLDKTTIAWEFDSLKTTIETIYAFGVTDENIIMDRCKHCDNIFIANNLRSKYCSTACRNRENVKKSRERNSTE